jgi:hypothetical protein
MQGYSMLKKKIPELGVIVFPIRPKMVTSHPFLTVQYLFDNSGAFLPTLGICSMPKAKTESVEEIFM